MTRFVHNHGCQECEVTRKLGFITYHLIRLIHGEVKLQKMARIQGGRCAICRKKQDVALGVDHNHSTGKVRGLLCRECNLGLGHLQDSLKLLREAVIYMEKYS